MPLKTVAELWNDYRQKVAPQGFDSGSQFVETRRAFYAGVFAAFVTCSQMEDAEEEGVPHVTAMCKECEAVVPEIFTEPQA